MHRAAVRQFFMISLIYAIISGAVAFTMHPLGVDFMLSMTSASESHWKNLWRNMPLICLSIGAVFILTKTFMDREKMGDLVITFLGCMLFMWGFSMFKSTMPHIIPFWADAKLASLDQFLHFGRHPWEFIDWMRIPLGTEIVDYIYLKFWAWPAIVGPMLIVATDRNGARVKRYLMLFLFTWIFLGNLVAVSLMSVGPVFHDRLLGTDTFAGLMAVLATASEQQSLMGTMREWLWAVNTENYRGISSGISAFPSLHVAIAALTCLYLCERSKYLAPVGVGFLAFILMGSVLSGLHYAVDGYFSIIVVALAWAASWRISIRFTSPFGLGGGETPQDITT